MANGQHADGAVVQCGDDLPAGRVPATDVLWRVRNRAGRCALHVSAAPGSLVSRVWWVHLVEPRADGSQAQVALAFDRDLVASGTVLSAEDFVPLPVRSDEQVGVVRWDAPAAVVTEVFVAEPARRQGLGRALTFAANALQLANGLGPRVRGPGARTADGELLVASLSWTGRIPTRTAIARLDRQP